MINNHIICGKFDNRAAFGPLVDGIAKKIKLRNTRKSFSNLSTTLTAAIGEHKVWSGGRLWDVDIFLSMVAIQTNRRLLVLTNKEYLQIVQKASNQKIRVDVFETRFPIFKDIKYSSCLRANHEVLSKHLRKLEQLGIYFSSLSNHLSKQYSRIAVKRLNFKNAYDRNFFFAYNNGYQEVFKFKEERPERLIIALDFNSMYVDSMKGKFCNPSTIKYKNFFGADINVIYLSEGIYHVRLISAKPGFFLDYHPFKYKKLGRSYYFKMDFGDTIETVLHKEEIDYFSSFFERIEVIDGLFSEDTIEHPLLSKGLNMYAQRLYHRRRGDQVNESLCKISMQHMHSATNQKKFITRSFASMEQIIEFLSTSFLMNFDEVSTEEIIEFLIRHKYFGIAHTSRGYELSYLDTSGSDTVFSLSAQVVSNARLKMLRTLQYFLNHPSVELCYANIDSMHLSIHRDKVDGFLEENRNIISDELGCLKIEAIAEKGYWFDVGRYWLKAEDKVILFKNKGFNQKFNPDPFSDRRKVSNFVETPNFSHIYTYVAKLENSFSYQKRLKNPKNQESSFVRFGYEEVRTQFTANLTEAHEQLRSMKTKVETFRRIAGKIQVEGLGL